MKLPTKTSIAILHVRQLRQNRSISDMDKEILSAGFSAICDEYCNSQETIQAQQHEIVRLRGLVGRMKNDIADTVESLNGIVSAVENGFVD